MDKPHLIIVIGVSGSGKSTVAEHLATQLGLTYVEADDFHSDTNTQHMASGQPLTDEMRWPWIQSIHEHLHKLAQQQRSVALSFSGLREAYRCHLADLPFHQTLLFLDGPQKLILQRMQDRQDHFMPPELLQSQLDTLEPPKIDNRSNFRIDISRSLNEVLEQALHLCQQQLTANTTRQKHHD